MSGLIKVTVTATARVDGDELEIVQIDNELVDNDTIDDEAPALINAIFAAIKEGRATDA